MLADVQQVASPMPAYDVRTIEDLSASVQRAQQDLAIITRQQQAQTHVQTTVQTSPVSEKVHVKQTGKKLAGAATRVLYSSSVELVLESCREILLATGVFGVIAAHYTMLLALPGFFFLLLIARALIGRLGLTDD